MTQLLLILPSMFGRKREFRILESFFKKLGFSVKTEPAHLARCLELSASLHRAFPAFRDREGHPGSLYASLGRGALLPASTAEVRWGGGSPWHFQLH